MNVCIDIQAAIAQRAGVGRYTHQLVDHLVRTPAAQALRLFCFDFKGQGVPFDTGPVPVKRIRWIPGRAVQYAWRTFGWPPFDLFAGKCDICHFPNFFLPPLTRGRSVVTIHDVSFLRFPQFAEAKNLRFLSRHIRGTAARADAIITDSQFSANEIQTLLNVDPDRLFPIPLGIQSAFFAPQNADQAQRLARLGLDRPYLLTVGTLEPRKNIPFLIEVFEGLDAFDGDLVIAGMPGWQVEPILERMATSPRAARIRYLHYVADSDLPALYAGACLFLVASHYEGFGFPPLEAMASGTAVISSAGGSLPEVLGDGAMILDTFEADRWRDAVGRLLTDDTEAAALRAKGHRQVSRYPWSRTAAETWKVYQAVA